MQTFTYVENSSNPEYQSLDIYLPKIVDRNKKPPCVVYLFGGGFSMGNKSNVQHKPKAFTDRGFIFISVNYRLSKSEKHEMTAKHPDHVQDVAAAIAWIHKNIGNFEGDGNQIFLMGYSSGGHLASLVATDEKYLAHHNLNLNLLKGVISIDISSYDLVKMYQKDPLINFFRPFIENAFGKDINTLKEASPINHVKPGKNIPRFLLTHTRPEAFEINKSFADLVIKSGSNAKLISRTDKDHFTINNDIGTLNDLFTKEIFDFIENF